SHLIASPIVSDHCSHGMGAMGDEIVIAGEGRVWAAGSATAVNGVVPIVVVVGNGSVPAAIMPNEGRMVPLDPRVPAGQHHALSCKSLSPDIRSMDLKHVPLDGIDLILWRASRARRCKRHFWVGVDMSDIGTAGNGGDRLEIGTHPNPVH